MDEKMARRTVENLEYMIREYLENNTLELVSIGQGIANDSGDYNELRYYENDEFFFETFFESGYEVAEAIHHGVYNFNDEYVWFDCHGDLESGCFYDVADKHLDRLEEIIDYLKDYYYLIDMDSELQELFEELEKRTELEDNMGDVEVLDVISVDNSDYSSIIKYKYKNRIGYVGSFDVDEGEINEAQELINDGVIEEKELTYKPTLQVWVKALQEIVERTMNTDEGVLYLDEEAFNEIDSKYYHNGELKKDLEACIDILGLDEYIRFDTPNYPIVATIFGDICTKFLFEE